MVDTVDEIEFDDVIQALGQEFLTESRDSLQDLGELLENLRRGAAAAAPALRDIRRRAHTLKGLGGSFGFPAITLIAHRLEDYLARLEALDARHLDDVQAFLDAMQDIVERGRDPGSEASGRIMRALPAKGAADQAFRPTSRLEVLLVAPSGVLGRAVEVQLHCRGLRVVTMKSPIEAVAATLRMRPDLVIASAVMAGIDGVDLARALAAMKATRGTPFILLTSFPRAHPALRDLPESADIIRHDRDLDAEVSRALGRLPPGG